MREQRTVFGEVAGVYDEVRPGYPDELVATVLAYAGAPVPRAVEVGAGTGIGTAAFVRGGVAVHCVEADAQMAGVLAGRFAGDPAVSVQVTWFEDWTPPPGGVPLLFCAQAWHWMPPESRCARAYAALAPGGVVALFSHKYRFADPALEAAVTRAYAVNAPELVDPDLPGGPVLPPERHWLAVELAASGLFADLRAFRFERIQRFPTARYLALVRTFSPFRMLDVQRWPVVLDALRAVVEAHGGAVDIRLDTVLALGRRAS